MRKGQTALEYLITYGWAILVILVVLAVLWYYGIFNPSGYAGEQVKEGTAFQVLAYQLHKDRLDLALGNKLGVNLNVTKIVLTGDAVGTNSTLGVSVNAGSNATMRAPVTSGIATTANAGQTMSITATITYDDLKTGLTGKSDVVIFNIKTSGVNGG